MRKRDVVLMATVTSYESLSKPSRIELRQFAELFRPLYENSSDEARRQAVAALARCATLPQAVCFFIGSQPISIAAIFLSQSSAIGDRTLIDIARSQGGAHARAIASRDDISPIVVDALAALHDGSGHRDDPRHAGIAETSEPVAAAKEPVDVATMPDEIDAPEIVAAAHEAVRLAREEALREELRHLVARNDPDQAVPKILKGASGHHQALIVRFARTRQTPMLAHTLADALDASTMLADRIMLDVSGVQLATTLVALSFTPSDIRFVLCRVYPHLGHADAGRTRAQQLLRSLDPASCVQRVAAWRRADAYTRTGDMPVEPELLAAAAENQNAAVLAATPRLRRV